MRSLEVIPDVHGRSAGVAGPGTLPLLGPHPTVVPVGSGVPHGVNVQWRDTDARRTPQRSPVLTVPRVRVRGLRHMCQQPEGGGHEG